MIEIFNILGATPSVYYVFENSDAVGKAIVLLLGVSSIFTWSIMLDKAIGLYQAKSRSERFMFHFRSKSKSIANALIVGEAKREQSPVADVYISGVEKLLEFSQNDEPYISYSNGENPQKNTSQLTDEQYNAIEAVLEREVSGQIFELEDKIGLLATMVSVCPFLGLFGTVWGVMLAFAGIAIAGKPDFAALAPGVAGALLTTVAGLVVAIPSLVGYNLLTSTIRKLTVYMDNFTEEFMVRLQLEQLNIARNNQSSRPKGDF